MAAFLELPVIFVCEDNKWAISVPKSHATCIDWVSDRASAYGISGIRVPNNDAIEVFEAAAPATTSPGTFEVSAKTSYIWQNVPPGQHTFTVQLVNNDNTPLDPPVTVRANVTLK